MRLKTLRKKLKEAKMKTNIDSTQSRSKILVSFDEAAHLLSISKRSLSDMIGDETGPKPVVIGLKKYLFSVKELERWRRAIPKRQPRQHDASLVRLHERRKSGRRVRLSPTGAPYPTSNDRVRT